jgi:hypothetical protein
MKTRLLIFVSLMLIIPLPVYAYGDPSGGMLFQILTPILAMLWGAWMIFANRVRRGAANFIRKFRKVEHDDQAPPDGQAVLRTVLPPQNCTEPTNTGSAADGPS